jgi:hypothetical protein
MKKKSMKKILAVILTFALILPVIQPLPALALAGDCDDYHALPILPFASSACPPDDDMHFRQISVSDDAEELSDTEINNFDPYIVYSSRGYVISAEGRASLSMDEIVRIEQILSHSNQLIDETKDFIEQSTETNWYSTDMEGITVYEAYENPLTRSNGVNRIRFRWFGVRIHISRNTMRVAATGVAIAGIWVTGGKALKIARTLGVSLNLVPRGVWFDASLTFRGLLNTRVTLRAGWQ